MTKPTVERTPVEEAWSVMFHKCACPGEEFGTCEHTKAVEESIRADEATRWREAVQEYVESYDAWNDLGYGDDRLDRVQEADARLRALLQEEAR